MNPQVYKPGKCWWGLKTNQKNVVKPCGLDARAYDVKRSELDQTSSPSVKMYLCINHKPFMEKAGYVLTLAIE